MARRYGARLSGPIRDRLDLWVSMEEPETLVRSRRGEASRAVARRVAQAWERQRARQGRANGEMDPAWDPLADDGERIVSVMAHRARRLVLSPRRVRRVGRVARTIADLDGSPRIERAHIDEALAYRPDARVGEAK